MAARLPRRVIEMHKVLRSLLLLAAVLLPSLGALMAQPVGGPPPCWPPPCIPIDGGMSALVAAGLLYGGAKAVQMRRRGQA